MGVRYRELVLLLAVCALALGESINKAGDKEVDNKAVENKATESKKEDDDTFLFQYDDFDAADDQEVLYNENRPCPRDCICTVSQGYRTAKCDRLEIGTQKFGDDITDLVIENADPKYPIELTDSIFKKLGLHQVTTIKIVNSTIASIAPNAFHGLPNLYAVNLSNDKLKDLHPETFAHNKKLLLLTLPYNPLKFPAADSQDYFLNTSSVQELDVSYCNIKYITANTFKNMPGLMYLNLASNSLSNMDPDTFKKLLDLEELDLSDNNIKSLPDDIFSENNELATLHISRNPVDTVYGLQISDLLTLNAGQTNIRFVGPSMFNGMTYIANLNLSGNSIEKIHNQAFHKLVELNYLDLSYNDLDFISNILIKENMELDIFKISNNPKLKHLPADGFECSVDQFNIYLFDASNCGLQEISDNALKTFSALSVVNLSKNEIKTIGTKVFTMCPKLIEINLSYNQLTTLNPKVFEKNNGLGKLYLQGNPLKVLSAEVFVHTPMITYLDMSHAELTSLWKATDKSRSLLSNLTFLNVSHNRITEIKQTELDHLNKLNTLDISNNPLACSRDFENLMTWLSNRKVSPNASGSNSIANLAWDKKDDDIQTYSWEFLTRKTCGTAMPHPVEPLPPVSDEEIWERIDKDADGNFDLKDTLDDGKIADDTKFVIQETAADDNYKDDADDDDDDALAPMEDDDDEDEDEDESEDDDDDGDVNLKVKLIEKPSTPVTPGVSTTVGPNNVNINIKLLENEPTDEKILASSVYIHESEEEHGRYEYLWPITIAILGALLLLIVIAKVVMMMCNKRTKQIRYNSAIIAAMSQASRTKKDCGLVYQQLTEDLTSPTTPKLNRYTPLQSVTVNATNMSYESSPFHHSNIVPEAV